MEVEKNKDLESVILEKNSSETPKQKKAKKKKRQKRKSPNVNESVNESNISEEGNENGNCLKEEREEIGREAFGWVVVFCV